MNICASYHVDFKHRKMLNEIRFTTGTIDQAIEFSEANPEITIILECLSVPQSNLSFEKIAAIIHENSNWVLDCYEMSEYVQFATKHKVDRIMYHYPVNTYAMLYMLMQFHPWAVSISEPLTFSAKMVRESVDSMSQEGIKTKIRVHPAVGRPVGFNWIKDVDNGVKHFWIPPHMVYLYEPYFDVLDLFDSNATREQALIDVYTSGSDTYSLRILCNQCDTDVLCSMWGEEEISKRMNCGQSCMRKPNNCHYCDMVVDLIHLTEPNRE